MHAPRADGRRVIRVVCRISGGPLSVRLIKDVRAFRIPAWVIIPRTERCRMYVRRNDTDLHVREQYRSAADVGRRREGFDLHVSERYRFGIPPLDPASSMGWTYSAPVFGGYLPESSRAHASVSARTVRPSGVICEFRVENNPTSAVRNHVAGDLKGRVTAVSVGVYGIVSRRAERIRQKNRRAVRMIILRCRAVRVRSSVRAETGPIECPVGSREIGTARGSRRAKA